MLIHQKGPLFVNEGITKMIMKHLNAKYPVLMTVNLYFFYSEPYWLQVKYVMWISVPNKAFKRNMCYYFYISTVPLSSYSHVNVVNNPSSITWLPGHEY